MKKKRRCWVNFKALGAKFRPNRDDALEQVLWILKDCKEDKTVLPHWYKGRELELVQELANHGIDAECYYNEWLACGFVRRRK